MMCNALGINPNFKHVAINKGEQRTEAFLAINSQGKVPVLQDGDFVLTQSNAILNYLARKHNSKLWPEEPQLQALIQQTLFWEASEFSKKVSPIAHRKIVLPFWGFNKTALSEEHWQLFHEAHQVLDQKLNGDKYLICDRYTLADVCLAAFFVFYERMELPLAQYPKIQYWFENIIKQKWFISTQYYLDNILDNNEHIHAYT